MLGKVPDQWRLVNAPPCHHGAGRGAGHPSSWSRSAGRSTRARATCQPMSGRSWRWGGGITGRSAKARGGDYASEKAIDQNDLKLNTAAKLAAEHLALRLVEVPAMPSRIDVMPFSGSGGALPLPAVEVRKQPLDLHNIASASGTAV